MVSEWLERPGLARAVVGGVVVGREDGGVAHVRDRAGSCGAGSVFTILKRCHVTVCRKHQIKIVQRWPKLWADFRDLIGIRSPGGRPWESEWRPIDSGGAPAGGRLEGRLMIQVWPPKTALWPSSQRT